MNESAPDWVTYSPVSIDTDPPPSGSNSIEDGEDLATTVVAANPGSPSGRVALRGADTLESLHQIKAQIDQAAISDSDDAVSIDLTELTGRQPQRSIGRFGPIVANLLLRKDFQLRPLAVHPPENRSPTGQLARSGVLFAIARHDSEFHVQSDQPSFLSAELRKWQRDWRAVAPREALFDIASIHDGNEPDEFGDRIVALLNPSPSKIDVASRQNAIYPWLRDITKGERRYTAEARRRMLGEISIITTELLDNVAHHARASKSLLTLSRIEGQAPCLQMAVVDNGCGIATSLADRGEFQNVVHYMERLVENRHSLRRMGRGDGIAKIARRVLDCEGSLLLASGPNPYSGKTVVVDYDHRVDNRTTRQNCVFEDNLGVQGTVAVVRIPLDPAQYLG